MSNKDLMKQEINIAIEKLENLRFKPKSFPEFMGVQGSETYSYTQEDEREYKVWQQIGFQYNSQLDQVITFLRKLIQQSSPN